MTMRRILRKMRALLLRRRLDAELREELQTHLELEAGALRRQGLERAEAKRRAALAFGSADAAAEACRDVRAMPVVESSVRAVRMAARSLWRTPAFAAACVVVLALGIGATTVVWSVADAVLFRPLPYGDEERLFIVFETNERQQIRLPSYPVAREWRQGARTLEALVFVRGETLAVRGVEGTALLGAGYSDADLFRALGAAPVIGRGFTEEEVASGAAVAVLSWDIWRDRYGGDAGVLGSELSTEHGPVLVIGVMGRGVRLPAWADLWLPIGALPPDGRRALERRDLHADGLLLGRVAAGVPAARAVAELSGFAARASQVDPDARGWSAVTLQPVREQVLGAAPTRLLVVGIAAGVLLLVSCVNVAGLFLARSTARSRELAVRAALGASRARLAGQLLAEALLLAVAGAAIGSLVGVTAMRLASAGAAGVLPALGAARVDPRAFIAASLAGALVAVLFSLAPAWRAARVAPMEALRGARGSPRAGGTERLRSGLVIAQLALAVVLVIGAATLGGRLIDASRVDLGFDPSGLVTIRVIPPAGYASTPDAALAFHQRLGEAVERIPGVRAVAWTNHLPLSGTSMPSPVRTSRAPDPDERPLAFVRTVSVSFFDTLGLPLLQGRPFTEAEIESRTPVVIVNRTLAAREWPDGDVVGRSITLQHVVQGSPDFGEAYTATVIGVAGDTRHFGPGLPEVPAVYVPWTVELWNGNFLVVASDGDAAAIIEPVRRTLSDIEPLLPVSGPGRQNRVRTLDEYAGNLLAAERVGAALLGSFATAALLLSAVGLFGVVAYLVLLRRREYGVRLALGASPAGIVRLVMVQGTRLAAAGLGTGIVVAWLAERALAGVQPALEPAGPSVFLVAVGVFAFVAMLASLLPAGRAARMQPGSILREEG